MTQTYNVKKALENVNPYREIVIEYDCAVLPINSIYIEDNKVIISTTPIDDDCENCIHHHNDCPDDKPIEYGPTCEFIPKNKIILYDQ